jgi:hypothetical protein
MTSWAPNLGADPSQHKEATPYIGPGTLVLILVVIIFHNDATQPGLAISPAKAGRASREQAGKKVKDAFKVTRPSIAEI